MSIKITASNTSYPLTVDDVEDGIAYISRISQTVYIGNACQDIVAFSLDGHSVLFNDDTDVELREVNLEVVVKA